MKKVIFIFVFFVQVVSSYSQQMPHYSQYMHNGFVLNPAIAGSNGCINFGLNVRKQWLGFEKSPFTQSAFVHSSIGNKNGLGLIIFKDVAGAESMLGAELAYAYMLKRTKNEVFSLGISAKIMQYSFNESTFETYTPSDPGLTYGVLQTIQPDVAFGAYFKNKKIFWSLGVQQLLSSTINVSSITFLERHYFFSAGYMFAHNKKLSIEPSFLLKAIENTNISFDLNLKAIFNKNYIVGLSYRNHDAIVLLFGVTTGRMIIAYNYDLNTSKLFNYNKGSHEVFLGYKICKNKRNKKEKANELNERQSIPCPSFNR